MSSFLDELRKKHDREWPEIAKAKLAAEQVRKQLHDLLMSDDDRLVSDECSIVVLGSVARDEKTSRSDLDWTLLIDGQADPNHRTISHTIRERIRETFKSPNPEGAFGGMAFSHNIIHQIGGQEDTNSSITRRILLLLESQAIGERRAYENVLRSVLRRYLEDDISFSKRSSKKQYGVPRFLLNDVVRYWRTMAVDYAHKRAARAGKGWATRNIKLRLSRKLIFASGMLMCFSPYLSPKVIFDSRLMGTSELLPLLTNHLMHYVGMTPLEILAEAFLKCSRPEASRDAFDAYDAFLVGLDNSETRDHLDGLDPSQADSDELFQEMRSVSEKFQGALTRLFFDESNDLHTLTMKYGVF